MHVVHEFETKQGFQEKAKKDRFLVRMNVIVSVSNKKWDRPEEDDNIEERFQQRRPDFDIAEQLKARNPDDADTLDIDVLALTVSQKVNLNTELRCDQRPVVHAKGRSSRGEERLRSDHEGLHNRNLSVSAAASRAAWKSDSE